MENDKMRKKKLEKLKEEIKKELKKEFQKQELQQNKPVKVLKDPVLNHSKEELVFIQKSFLKIFIFSFVILCVLFVIFLIRPSFGTNESISEEDTKNEVVDEYDPINATLFELKEEKINNKNKYLRFLVDQITFKNYEYYVYDSTYLYSKDELNINEVSSDYLLFLLSKTKRFNEYISEQNLKTKIEVCNASGAIRIKIEDIIEMISTEFNTNLKEYKDFIYTYYVDGEFSTYIKFVYSDGYYVSFCYDTPSNITYNVISNTVLEEAYKEEKSIRILIRAAFITEDNVYADYKLTNVISNNINADVLDYINEADQYEFVFKTIDNYNYYLEKVVKR